MLATGVAVTSETMMRKMLMVVNVYSLRVSCRQSLSRELYIHHLKSYSDSQGAGYTQYPIYR